MVEQRTPNPMDGGSSPSRPAIEIMFKRIKKFLLDVQKELKKVSWPAKNEIKESTVIVIIAVGISAVFIGAVDFFLGNILSKIIRQ